MFLSYVAYASFVTLVAPSHGEDWSVRNAGKSDYKEA